MMDGPLAIGDPVPEPRDARLAVLIDADNTSASSYAVALLEEIAKYGTPTVKRAYGDWTTSNLKAWKDVLPRLAIQPMQQFANTAGKNATDSAMIIDAMDLLYTRNFDAFALVSSDSDFTRLATRLRESGATVYGLGMKKTPEPFQAACDRFIFLEVLGVEDPDSAVAPPEPDPKQPNIRNLLTRAVNNTSQDDGWAHLSALGSYLTKNNPSFDPRNYGFSKLSALARAQDYLEVTTGAGTTPRVRVKPTAKKAATKKTTAKKQQ